MRKISCELKVFTLAHENDGRYKAEIVTRVMQTTATSVQVVIFQTSAERQEVPLEWPHANKARYQEAKSRSFRGSLVGYMLQLKVLSGVFSTTYVMTYSQEDYCYTVLLEPASTVGPASCLSTSGPRKTEGRLLDNYPKTWCLQEVGDFC